MILNSPESTAQKMGCPAEKCNFLQKNALSCRKMPFPAEKCTFLQKNEVFGGHVAGNLQEIAGLQGSRSKNAGQLSQDKWWNGLAGCVGDTYFRSGPGKPNQRKSVYELRAGAFRNKSSM